MSRQSALVILGGTSLICAYLMARLGGGEMPVHVAARRHIELPNGFHALPFDPVQPPGWNIPEGATLISLLPLPVLVSMLPRCRGVTTVVALGSTSRFSKAASPDAADRQSAATLASAERELADWCLGAGTRFTLLRPTLVYDLRNDRNLARMARFIGRYRLLPLARPANGLRQPIHADDVAKAILAAIDNEAAFDHAFNIGGGERLTYRAMAERVFLRLGIRPRFLMLPTGLLRTAFSVAETTGVLRESAFGSSVFHRMNEDLVFDDSAGLKVLRYDPRPFDLPHQPRPGDLDHRAIDGWSNRRYSGQLET